MKETRRSFLTSCTALILCFAMLLGTTFAWFTDMVTSSGNKIVSGTLDLDLQLKDKETGNYSSINESSDPVFDYDKWEPGYTDTKILKVENVGSLSFKWVGNFVSREAISKLAEVIEVYIKTSDTDISYPAGRDEITLANGWKNVGTLDEIIDSASRPVSGELLRGEADYFAITLKMQEGAGNEYQDLSLGAFDIAVHAAQFTSEQDSFGDDYDTDAKWPEGVFTSSINASANVTADADGKLSNAVSVQSTDNKIGADLPAGVLLQQGTDKITVHVSNKAQADANVTLSDTEKMLPIDVHIDGVAEDNDVAIAVFLSEWLPAGLNMGNYQLYHVENGQTNEMNLISDGQTPVHNDFKYNPNTGDVTLYLASFSEIALVADTENAWEGKFDYTWYDASKNELTIANADQLAAFGAIVGGMKVITGIDGEGKYIYSENVIQDSFSGKTVKLLSDINLGDKENENNPDIIFYPIGYYNSEGTYERTNTAITSGLRNFEGTFDGNGNTISNFYQNTWEMKGDHDWYSPEEQYYRDGMGLFGRVYKGTVKNLTVSNFSSDGEIATTGVIAAYADGATFENIAIFECNPRVYNIGNGGIVGCVGWYAKEANLKTTFKNITVDNTNKISALWGSYDVACGGILGQYYPTSGQTSANKPANGGISFENCHVSAVMDVYNDVCANYQYYAYRYTGMLIGSVRENVTIDGHVYPKMDGITAKNCTVHFGTWNDYYYCEIIDNTTASYTHDYQMSRLTEIKAIDGTTITYLDGTTGTVPATGRANYVIVDYSKGHGTENATCYHFKDGKVWNHSDAGTEIVDGKEVLVEDKQHIYLEFNNLVTGYGWGVTSRGFSNLEGVTNLDIAQGEYEESVVKFEDAGYAPKDYRPGETITIGDLFKAKDGVTINKDSVYVSASAIVSGETVGATFNLDENDWTKSTITFNADCNGTAKISITDYIFCTPTVIYLNLEQAAEKFTANSLSAQNAYTQIALGTLFGVKNGATIGNVTATVTDPNGNNTTVTGTSSEWATKTIDIIKEGTWTVAIKDDDAFCAATETKFTVNKVDKFIKLFDKDFLYRVGNQNTVTIGTIFSEIETAVKLSSVNVKIENVAGNASGIYTSNGTWGNGTVQFSGTGVVKVTISADGANAVELHLEVIEATNITSAIGYSGNDQKAFVLIKDVNASSYVNYWNCTLYGNGFTYSLKGAPTAYNSKQGHGILITKNATLDNLVIVGDVYNSYAAFSSQDDYNAAIDVAADTIIQNCYISGCAAPVRARSNVTIKDTTLYGGAIANMVIMSGTSTLENVITANYSDGRALVGLGVVVHSDATEGTKLVLKGTFTQHNFMSESNAPTDSYAKNIHSAMFKDNCKQYHFGTSPNRYVNTGIISMTSTFTTDDIIDNANTGYVASDVTLSGYDGFVYTQPNTSGSINNEYDKENDSHYSKVQGAVPPSYFFDYTNKNYVAKADGSNDYCYEENGKVNISMDDGDTFNWDTSILLIGKGITIYTVSMNGIDYTGKSIAFKTSGDYIVTYTYTDDINYTLDENGNVTLYSVTYTKTVNITVSVIKDTTKHAEFTMGSSNTATEKITVDNATYISATGVTADGTKWGSMNVNGTTIIFPIIEATIVQTKASSMISTNAEVQAHFYVFDGVITITDYENAGTGNKVIFNSDTKDLPTGLNVVKGKYGAITTDWYKNSDSNLTSISLAAFRYAASTDGTLGTYQNKLCYSSPSGLSTKNRGEYYTIAQYSYTDNAGSVYYYYVGYHMQNSKNVAPDYSSGCFAEGSLVTLADGTQKPIEEITFEDQLLAWDFNTGKYAVTVPSLIDRYELSEQNVINLKFSDGSVVRMVVDHGFFDVTENKFVFLNEENVANYVGHTFVKASDNGTYENVELVGYEITVENVAYYSIQTAFYNNCIVEGMFTLTAPPEMLGYYGWFDYFEIGDGMKYDEDKMNADIEKYGLYTYEDFAEYVTYEQFIAFNGPYLKVLVGRGVVTYDEIIDLISMYVNPEI